MRVSGPHCDFSSGETLRERGQALPSGAAASTRGHCNDSGHHLSLPRTAEVTDINIRPMLKSY